MTGFATDVGRINKAKKIEAALCHFLKRDALEGLTILDIGTGSGIIAQYFAGNNIVYGVDVEDQIVGEGKQAIRFSKVATAKLPFQDDMFDVVISNHVIEHLGDQQFHLAEIRRVLKKGAVCYLASPNRVFPFEVHYKLPLLHYLPTGLFRKILKLIKVYREDVNLLSYHKMLLMFRRNRLFFEDYAVQMAKDPDAFYLESRYARRIPEAWLRALRSLTPTCVFILSKRD